MKTSEQKRQFLEILEKVAAHVRENGAFLWDPYELTEDRVFTDESMPCLGLADGVPVGTILLYDRDEFFWDDRMREKAMARSLWPLRRSLQRNAARICCGLIAATTARIPLRFYSRLVLRSPASPMWTTACGNIAALYCAWCCKSTETA